MRIEKEVSLKDYNTFGIEAQTDWLIHYESLTDLETLVRDEYFQECRYLHIGEGSNLLFLANFHGIILHSELISEEILYEDDERVDLLVGSGLNWDKFVAQATERGFYGAECLSLIPGQVGSSAIQNIGAYGLEVKDLIVSVHTLNRRSGEKKIFSQEDCQYRYRHSIFKEQDYADYIVTHVHFRLSKKPNIQLNYKDLSEYFTQKQLELSPENLRKAVISIREAKLPEVKDLGNAGSFFMNPIVSQEKAESLKLAYPKLVHYPLENGNVKLGAGWLIDQCGFKGYRKGQAGVYERQALVLVNHGGATGQDIANLAQEIQEAVYTQFQVELKPEVRYIN